MKLKFNLYMLALTAWAMLSSGVALGHSSPRASIPAYGAVVEGSPPVITIDFRKPMRITHATLENTAGKPFDLERPGGVEASEVFKGVPETLPPGEYRLEWRGLAGDGHVVSGDLQFTVK